MLRFKPYCLNCGSKFHNIDCVGFQIIGDELHFSSEMMGGINCPECNEGYDYQIRKNTLTLRRSIVPIGTVKNIERDFPTINDELGQSLINVSRLGFLDDVTRLLDKGADHSQRDKRDNSTALINAAYHGHDEVVRLLIDRGADINAKNDSGKTALMYALSNGYVKVVMLLIRKKLSTMFRS